MSHTDTPFLQGIPRIGGEVPDFTAATAHGELIFNEYNRDKWIILFAHPADFYPQRKDLN